MAQDPAFLFYTGDFHTGTQFFTDDQLGKYLRLLMAQHQHGHLTEKQVLHICKSYDFDIMEKFVKDGDDLYYNVRLEIEINKRKSYTESRGKNKLGKLKTNKSSSNKSSKSYDLHMEDENKDKNRDKNRDITKEVISLFNSITGRETKLTETRKSQISARLKEGYKLDDFKKVIEKKTKEWNDTDMQKYLDPDTLFSTKFTKYLEQPEIHNKKKTQPVQSKIFSK